MQGAAPRPQPTVPRVAAEAPFVLRLVAYSRSGSLNGDPATPPRGVGRGSAAVGRVLRPPRAATGRRRAALPAVWVPTSEV